MSNGKYFFQASLLLCMLAYLPSAFSQAHGDQTLQELEAQDYDLRAKAMSARMSLMQDLFDTSERDFKMGGLTTCVSDGTARLEEIGESEQYATNSVTPGIVFLRDKPDRSDFATAIFTRKLVISRYELARQTLKDCVAKHGR